MKMFEQRGHTGNKGDVFAYDEFRRLKDVKFNSVDPQHHTETTPFDKSWGATYDKVDNILNIVKTETGQPDEIIEPTIDKSGDNAKLNQYTEFDGWGLGYDKNGNLTQKGTQSFTYDYRNQVVKAVDGQSTTTFKYDALGRRIEKTTGSNTTNYYYSGFQVIEERDGSDTLQKQFIYGSGIDEILRIDKYDGGTSTPYYLHTNAIGSVTAITDDTGNLVERVSYDVFGMPTFTDATDQPLTSSSIGNNILFQGRRYDKETNLYYYRARYYDPIMGRFLQTDPMGYADSMNLYQGFNMNPANFVDPMGMEHKSRRDLLNILALYYLLERIKFDPNVTFENISDQQFYANWYIEGLKNENYEVLEAEYNKKVDILFPKGFFGKIAAIFGYLPDKAYDETFEFMTHHLGQRDRKIEFLKKDDLDFLDASCVLIEDSYKEGTKRAADIVSSIVEEQVNEAQVSALLYVVQKVNRLRKLKSVNLPAWRKVEIDVDHIVSGHMKGGARVSRNKTLFPEYMTKNQIEKTVRDAYRSAKRIHTQGSRVLVRGQSGGLTIEMWVNTETRIIESAYPIY